MIEEIISNTILRDDKKGFEFFMKIVVKFAKKRMRYV